MLNIREEQMRVLGEAMRRQFELRALAWLKYKMAEQVSGLADEELLRRIHHGTGRAASHGIRNEADVVRYLEYMQIYGNDFDRDPNLPWASKVLETAGLSGTEKMDRIDEYDEFAR